MKRVAEYRLYNALVFGLIGLLSLPVAGAMLRFPLTQLSRRRSYEGL